MHCYSKLVNWQAACVWVLDAGVLTVSASAGATLRFDVEYLGLSSARR